MWLGSYGIVYYQELRLNLTLVGGSFRTRSNPTRFRIASRSALPSGSSSLKLASIRNCVLKQIALASRHHVLIKFW